ncbi:MAG: hypothetical protein Q8Q25_02420 [bacterium]|nr:hypothetical protein [bacterium]
MQLNIISPEKKQNFTIVWLEVQTTRGSFVIQEGHAPLILLLKSNESIVFRLKTGKQESVMVEYGIIEIDRKQATVIINKKE